MPSQEPHSRLRVTLALPAGPVPDWIRRLHSRLQDADFVTLATVTVAQNPEPKLGGSLLFRLWMKLETKLFGHKIATHESSESLVNLAARTSPISEPLEADVLVWMLPGRPPPEYIGMTRHGVLTTAGAFDATFGLDEFLRQIPATRCDVITLNEVPGEDQVLVSSYANTDAILFSRGINGLRAKCRAMLMATLKRLWLQAEPRLDGLPERPETAGSRSAPGGLRIIFGLTRVFARFVAARIFSRGDFDQWQLAYRLDENRFDQADMRFLAPSHKGFWADPFIAQQDGRRFIFYEELSPVTNRGHLAAIEVYKDGQTGDPVDILVSDFHLSYPFMLEYQDALFMVPECGDSGRVEALRCKRFPDRWEPHAILLDDIAAFDPTLIEHDGRWWMFVTIEHDGNSCNDELHLFYASDVFGEWQPHALNPVRLDVRAARPAGAIYRENGKLYRPAQDCSGRYGRAISIQEIRRMTPDDYEEVEVRRITADFAPGGLGTHTVNQAHGMVVFDCEVRAGKAASATGQ